MRPDANTPKKPLWWLLAAVGICAAAVVAAAFLWYPPLSQPGYAPLSDAPFIADSPDEAGEVLVNVNTAGLPELTALPGIGPKKAQDIIDHRAANGDFEAAEELLEVPGIGPATLEGLEGLITF